MANPVINMRRDAVKIFQAGIEAADPYKAVKNCFKVCDDHTEILLDLNNPEHKRIGRWNKIHLIAFGKAACAMADAAQEIIPIRLLGGRGIAVTNYENVTAVANVEVIGAGHPLPDQSGINAAKIVAEHAKNAEQRELVLVLISGGGSALIPYPADSITLDDKITTTQLLLGCSANINQINCIRKHLSKLKGGGLAGMAAPADLHALILSDVLGDDLSSIASGPTVPDNTTFQDAIDVLKSKKVWDKTHENVRDLLLQGSRNLIPETPKPLDSVFDRTAYTLIGSNAISVNAIVSAADKLGYESKLYSENLCGEARDEAENLVKYIKNLIDRGFDKPTAILAGGETTVTLKGDGRGGRNQEMAMAFALAAERYGLTGSWVFLSGGTDGRDGPTDAAGGIVDPNTLMRMKTAGLNPVGMLNNNDSFNALKQSQDLLDTGATGTNVADLQVLLVQSPN